MLRRIAYNEVCYFQTGSIGRMNAATKRQPVFSGPANNLGAALTSLMTKALSITYRAECTLEQTLSSNHLM